MRKNLRNCQAKMVEGSGFSLWIRYIHAVVALVGGRPTSGVFVLSVD